MILKQIPEDFVVEEIPNYTILKEPCQGCVPLFKLYKRDVSSFEAFDIIAKKLNVKRTAINYAGLKDKRAVTIQYITIKNAPKKASSLDLGNIKLEHVGYLKNPLYIGALKGNKFKIVVRDLDTKNYNKVEDITIPNYFDEQRVGFPNPEIGYYIIKKEFEKAVSLIIQDTQYRKQVDSYLRKNPTDFIGAIKQLPFYLQRFFVHSFQSQIFNEALSTYIQLNSDYNGKIMIAGKEYYFPLIKINLGKGIVPGFGIEVRDDFSKFLKEFLKERGVDERDFVVRSIPHATGHVYERDLSIEVKNFSIEFREDELHAGKYKSIVSFELPKGSYATIVIKCLFSREFV